jgi:hypothetical protein
VGRRQRRTRTGVVAAGIIAAVALGAATAPQWLSHVPGRVAPGSGLSCEGGGPLPSEAPADPTAPTHLDVLRHWVDVTGVSGYELVGYATARLWQVAQLATPNGDQVVTVTLYSSGGVPHFWLTETQPEVFDPAAGTPTTPVAGNPAYWLPKQDFRGIGSGGGVAWQWAPGAWVLVAASDDPREIASTPSTQAPSDVDLAAWRAAASQVAAELKIGPGAPVVAPFSIPVPDCIRLKYVNLMRDTTGNGTPFYRYTLGFGSEESVDSNNPLASPGDSAPQITITADSVATPSDKPGSATSEVDGHPAYQDGGFLVVHGVDGFALEITTQGGPESAIALYRSIHMYPGAHSSESAWATPIAELVPSLGS